MGLEISTTPDRIEAIEFDGEPGTSSKINYNVPLPGSHQGRRVLELDLGLNNADWSNLAKQAGTAAGTAVGVSNPQGGGAQVDISSAKNYFIQSMRKVGVPDEILKSMDFDGLFKSIVGASSTVGNVHGKGVAENIKAKRFVEDLPLAQRDRQKTEYQITKLENEFREFLHDILAGKIRQYGKKWGQTGYTTSTTLVETAAHPRLFLVEVYGISSFLGNYGLGRTVKTFTLLPGESTTISMKTWRSSKQSISEGSSIIDSHDESAASKFSSSIQDETTDKQTQSSTEEWHAEAEVSASWGWGNAKASGGGSGEYHNGQEQFARQAAQSVNEHASEASSKRELSITSSSERSEETGEETVIERTIKNVNMRRTLNFVFRELNQEYVTKIHLKDIRVCFCNGRVNSWREVPLSGLRGLLSEVLTPGKIDAVASAILKSVCISFDWEDKPVPLLQKITMNADGQDWKIEAALPVNGQFSPPTESMSYRFKRGALAQDGKQHKVDGVVKSEQTIVMRTDSVFVEALLGQADALDNYALMTQHAATEERVLVNAQKRLALEMLNEIDDPEARAKAYGLMFNPPLIQESKDA